MLCQLAFRPTDTAKTSSLAGSRAACPGCQRLSRTIDYLTFLSKKIKKKKLSMSQTSYYHHILLSLLMLSKLLIFRFSCSVGDDWKVQCSKKGGRDLEDVFVLCSFVSLFVSRVSSCAPRVSKIFRNIKKNAVDRHRIADPFLYEFLFDIIRKKPIHFNQIFLGHFMSPRFLDYSTLLHFEQTALASLLLF